MIDRRLVLTGLAAAGLPRSALAADATGAVESLTGASTAQARGATRTLAEGADIFVGDLVTTSEAARLVMKLGEATRVFMGASVKLRIDKYLAGKSGELRFEGGPMLIDRAESVPHMDLKLRSPFGLVALRGTKVFAGPSNGVFGVFVARGSVNFTSGGATVRVNAGQGSDVRRPGGRPSPARAWDEARIEAALASVN